MNFQLEIREHLKNLKQGLSYSGWYRTHSLMHHATNIKTGMMKTLTMANMQME